MLERILDIYKTANYDFRLKVCPEDPLSDLFEEWVDYYRLKWAIAKAIMPTSILEIGVRYGYSARAFLNASPEAKFVGIDLDIPTFGGSSGAVDWALESLQNDNYNVSMLKQNSQDLQQFPGEIYDLIHVDGQQDGDGTFHDLDLAVTQAHYILVDGYLWTRDNFLAINEWIWLNRKVIEASLMIPGYAGEFLIKTKLSLSTSAEINVKNKKALASVYIEDYKKPSQASHLQALSRAGMALGVPSKVIDLNAAHGELTRFFALQGSEVTAIAPSFEATDSLQSSIDEELKKQVTVVNSSVLNPDTYSTGQYDLALVSDLIEHLLPEENDKLYQLVSERLKSTSGTLIVHTAPNLWHYRYEHALDQKAAKRAGFWLPRTRRTWYERVMHINEQNPRVLKKQLLKQFPYVFIWFAEDKTMGGSLLRKFRVSDFRQAKSIFAIASHKPINREDIANAFCMKALNNKDASNISVQIKQHPDVIERGKQFTVPVIVTNRTNTALKSLLPYPFHLSYHWLEETHAISIFEGLRTVLVAQLNPGEQVEMQLTIKAPDVPGNYVLSVLPVQEGIRWLTESSCNTHPIVVGSVM